jgi:hypothetical protein
MCQGLLVTADAVSTPYAYEECGTFIVGPNQKYCTGSIRVEVESAPMTPPFVYQNQCASVLLTSYIPVLVIGFSLQLVLIFVGPLVLHRIGKWLGLMDITHGILWPEFWLKSVNSESRLEKNPNIVICSKSILCFNILNNLMIMLTFGLCSPILAVAVTCVVVSNMSMLEVLMGRYVKVLRGDDKNAALHFALVSMAKLYLPLNAVLKQSFWLIVWVSAAFVSLISWDIATDDVGLFESIWIPLVALCFPLLLWTIAFFVRNDRLRLCRYHRCEGQCSQHRNNEEVDTSSTTTKGDVVHSVGLELATVPTVSLSLPPPSLDTDVNNPMHV